MKNWKMKSLALGLFVAGILCSLPVFAQTKTITLNYETMLPAIHFSEVTNKAVWIDEIEKKTNGQVKIRVFPGGTLVAPDQAFDGVIKGIADFGTVHLGYAAGRFPLTEIFELPLGHTSGRASLKVFYEYVAKFKPKEFDEAKLLYAFCLNPPILASNKPIAKLEDVKGLKIRSTGADARVMSALGGTPVAMPMSEAYDALSRGVTDSIFCAMDALKSYKMAEVTKYITDAPSAKTLMIVVVAMNKSKFNSLPPDVQKIIEEVSATAGDKISQAWDEQAEEGKKYSINQGLKYSRISDEEDIRWAKAVAPLIEEYVRDKEAKGLPAGEVVKFSTEKLKQLR
jgi:TRAP-type transport system periplasmic protein